MALQKTYTSDQGVSGNYWRITKVSLDSDANDSCNVELALYKDAAARTANNRPLKVFYYAWAGSDYTGSFDAATLDTVNYNLKERAYEKLKTLTDPVDFTTGTTDV